MKMWLILLKKEKKKKENLCLIFQADLFHKRWNTPPSNSPEYVKRKFYSTKREDSEKGLERIGRYNLAATITEVKSDFLINVTSCMYLLCIKWIFLCVFIIRRE